MIARDLLKLLGGALLLYFGATWLVRGAAGIAAKLRVKPLIVGLTVVAYGTSTPELIVGVQASLAGRGGIAFGNATGSNIANLGLILGMTAVLSPPKVDPSISKRELPAMMMSAFAVPLLLLDGRISRLEGAALLLSAVLYTALAIRSSRATVADAAEMTTDARVAGGGPSDDETARPLDSSLKLVGLGVLGLGLLVVGGDWLVGGASGLARGVGISERMVGLTVVAVGTSLPELATSLVAARRGHSDLAVGNVIGSNIFNVLLILGASGAAGPLFVTLREARIELFSLIALTLAGALFMRGGRTISRVEGAVLLVAYVTTLAVLGFVQAH